MGLFYTAPKSVTPAPSKQDLRHHGSAANDEHDQRHHGEHAANDVDFGDRHKRISPYELKKQVRYDLHDKLGRSKGDAIFNTLMAHTDKDGGFGSTTGVSGREIEGMLHNLKENHQDNLRDNDIKHIEEVLGKHFRD